ncbi:LuxR C-terminal-related transcriptional regulator [Thermoactinospora rubra]|uniref:response regulator transcription factor n=1 Tax=Thermoactinospora rubra TaxID=1088767 RepID=UPI000A0F69F4
MGQRPAAGAGPDQGLRPGGGRLLLPDGRPRLGGGPQPLSPHCSDLTDRKVTGARASNREIARRLHITEGTAKNHISSCLRKLSLRDRTGLAIWIARRRPSGHR